MLEHIDKTLFLVINSLNSPFFDRVMWIISAKATWIPLYLAVIVMLALKYRRKALLIVPLVIMAVIVSDQLSVHAFKEVFMRLRPCHEPSLSGMVHLVNGRCGGKYGFVSSHASNSFTVAMFSLLMLKKRWFTWTIVPWAMAICYSRIYLGVHYPGDVICGSLLGILTGYAFFRIYGFADNKWISRVSWFEQKTSDNAAD